MSTYVIISGPNGAGKSTLYHISGEFRDIDWINVDAIVNSDIHEGKSPVRDYVNAAKIALERIENCFIRNRSFVQESTLSGKSILKNVERARDAGYKVVIHFIGLESVDIAKKRIRRRAAAGGHDIPDADIERRYKRSFKALAELIPLADEAYLYDNSEKFVRVAKFVDGKCIWAESNRPEWAKKLLPDM